MGKLPGRIYRTIYMDEWLGVTGRSRAQVAKAAEVDVSYIANMVSGLKKNPSSHVLFAMTEEMGITVNDLYRRPPPPDAPISALSDLSPGARDALMNRRN